MLHKLLVGKRHVATPRLREAQKRKPVATEGGACLQLQPLQERSDQVRFYPANPLRFSRRPPPDRSRGSLGSVAAEKSALLPLPHGPRVGFSLSVLGEFPEFSSVSPLSRSFMGVSRFVDANLFDGDGNGGRWEGDGGLGTGELRFGWRGGV